MGPTVYDVTLSLCNTIPQNGILYTSEKKMFPLMQKAGDKMGARVITVDENTVSNDELKHFSYLEHKENVALALAVCEKAGAARKLALEGMWKVTPDPGALRIHKTSHIRKTVKFVNGFAANDPESTYAIWEKLLNEGHVEGEKIIMLNTREDRYFRAIQLCEMMLEKQMEFDYLLLVGARTDDLVQFLKEHKLSPKITVKDWGAHTHFTPEKIYTESFHLFGQQATVYAIGNIGGVGHEIVQYFYGRKIPRL